MGCRYASAGNPYAGYGFQISVEAGAVCPGNRNSPVAFMVKAVEEVAAHYMEVA